MDKIRNERGQFIPGSNGATKHGMAKTRIYGIWSQMRGRCYCQSNAAFKDYGARGITVCSRWDDFANFYADMGTPDKGMSLDRIDNNKGYSPENCRWATRKTQARNKRGLRMVKARGETKSVGEWSEITGLAVRTICNRLDLGWDPEKAVTTPLVPQKERIQLKATRRTAWGSENGVVWTEPQQLVSTQGAGRT